MSTRIIGDLLRSTDELKALSTRTRRLQELQKLYLRSAPRELAGSSRVKSYKAGTLCVSADNGVIAAKLKQLAPTVLNAIRENDAEITGIRIEVQVEGTPSGERLQRKKPLPLQALTEFEALRDRVEGKALKLALATLVRRHRRRGTR